MQIKNVNDEIEMMLAEVFCDYAEEQLAKTRRRAERRIANRTAQRRAYNRANECYFGCPTEMGRYNKANPVTDSTYSSKKYVKSLNYERTNAKAKAHFADYLKEVGVCYV